MKFIPNKVEPNHRHNLNIFTWITILWHLLKLSHNQKMNIVQTVLAMKKYEQFLLLIKKYPHTRLVPNQEIDAVLHAHIANTNLFANDCQKLFNTSIKHIPEFGMGGEQERLEWQLIFAQTKELFETTFGKDSMGNSPPACCEILMIPIV